MFSWSKKNDTKKRERRRGGSGGPTLNEFGIPINEPSGNDEELEAELRTLTGGVISLEDDLELNEEGSDVEAEFERMFGQNKNKKASKRKAHQRNTENVDQRPGTRPDLDVTDVNDDDVEDEDLDVDENDPELLGELMGLTEEQDEEEEEEGEGGEEDESEENEPEKKEVTITSLLMERLNMYKAAEAKAKENNESSRARRFSRGIKTLQQLLKKAEAGQPVLVSEIPPVIATNLKPGPPPPPIAPSEPLPPSVESTQTITEPENDVPVREVSKMSVDDKPQEANEGNDNAVVVTPRPVPEEEKAIGMEEPSRRTADDPRLSILYSRREEYKASALAAKRNNDLETALKHVKCVKQLNALISALEMGEEIDESEIPCPVLKEAPQMEPIKFEAPDELCEEGPYEIPTTVLEALNQRLTIYQRFHREAELKGDEPGIRRNGKIIEIYREAIKLHKGGRKIPLLKLPTPPGCPPIPIPFDY